MSQVVTRLFDNFSDAERAVAELERAGVPESDISLVSHESTRDNGRYPVRNLDDDDRGDAASKDAGVGAGVGGVVGAAGGVLAGLGLLAIPGLGPVVAAGWLASTAVGAVVGGAVGGAAGGLVGALTHAGVSEEDAGVYAESVKRGSTLVTARVPDDRVAAAEAAIRDISHVDVAERGRLYRDSGWTGFQTERLP